MVGDGLDGPEWGQQPNTNMFNWANSLNPPLFPAYTGFGKFVKTLGAKSMALLSVVSPSATAAMKADEISLQKAGIDVGYTNYNIQFGTVDFSSEALAMKSAGVDGFAARAATRLGNRPGDECEATGHRHEGADGRYGLRAEDARRRAGEPGRTRRLVRRADRPVRAQDTRRRRPCKPG